MHTQLTQAGTVFYSYNVGPQMSSGFNYMHPNGVIMPGHISTFGACPPGDFRFQMPKGTVGSVFPVTASTSSLTTVTSTITSGHSSGNNVSISSSPRPMNLSGSSSHANIHPSHVIIENPCLAYMRSEMLRNDKML